MTTDHDQRVADASPADLIEAAIAALGWGVGQWTIELVMRDGAIEKVFAKASSGRSALLERRPGVAESDAA